MTDYTKYASVSPSYAKITAPDHYYEVPGFPAFKSFDATTKMDVHELEERFKGFKLKPKILTDLKSPDQQGRKSRSRMRKPSCIQCAFCMSNGEDEEIYRSHILKDPLGRVVCPVLYMYNCPICNNGGGPYAHTIRYCPKNRPNVRRRHRIPDVLGEGGDRMSGSRE